MQIYYINSRKLIFAGWSAVLVDVDMWQVECKARIYLKWPWFVPPLGAEPHVDNLDHHHTMHKPCRKAEPVYQGYHTATQQQKEDGQDTLHE